MRRHDGPNSLKFCHLQSKGCTGKPGANPFLTLDFFSELRIHSFILIDVFTKVNTLMLFPVPMLLSGHIAGGGNELILEIHQMLLYARFGKPWAF